MGIFRKGHTDEKKSLRIPVVSTMKEMSQGIIDEARHYRNNPPPPRPVIEEGLTPEIYQKRYSAARLNLIILMFASGASIWHIAEAPTLLGKCLGILATLIFSLLYLQWSYQLWRARDAWAYWSTTEVRMYSLLNFIDSVRDEPREILPLRLGGEPGAGWARATPGDTAQTTASKEKSRPARKKEKADPSAGAGTTSIHAKNKPWEKG